MGDTITPMDTNGTPGSLLGRLLMTQPVADLRVLRTEIVRDLNRARTELETLQNDLREVERAIAARTGQENPPLFQSGTPTNRTSPSLKTAIVQILDEAADRVWLRDELMAELDLRGVAPGGRNPRNTLSTRLAELAHKGRIKRVGDGFSSLKNEGVPAV
jgi:hypothetical protein